MPYLGRIYLLFLLEFSYVGLDITIIYASPVSLLVYDTYTIYGWFLVEPNETFVIRSKNYR